MSFFSNLELHSQTRSSGTSGSLGVWWRVRGHPNRVSVCQYLVHCKASCKVASCIILLIVLNGSCIKTCSFSEFKPLTVAIRNSFIHSPSVSLIFTMSPACAPLRLRADPSSNESRAQNSAVQSTPALGSLSLCLPSLALFWCGLGGGGPRLGHVSDDFRTWWPSRMWPLSLPRKSGLCWTLPRGSCTETWCWRPAGTWPRSVKLESLPRLFNAQTSLSFFFC